MPVTCLRVLLSSASFFSFFLSFFLRAVRVCLTRSWHFESIDKTRWLMFFAEWTLKTRNTDFCVVTCFLLSLCANLPHPRAKLPRPHLVYKTAYSYLSMRSNRLSFWQIVPECSVVFFQHSFIAFRPIKKQNSVSKCARKSNCPNRAKLAHSTLCIFSHILHQQSFYMVE